MGAPGEKPPRQRHAKRQPDPPLAPGERSYFATCPRCVCPLRVSFIFLRIIF